MLRVYSPPIEPHHDCHIPKADQPLGLFCFRTLHIENLITLLSNTSEHNSVEGILRAYS